MVEPSLPKRCRMISLSQSSGVARCGCGTNFILPAADATVSARIACDILLDAYINHRAFLKKERRRKLRGELKPEEGL